MGKLKKLVFTGIALLVMVPLAYIAVPHLIDVAYSLPNGAWDTWRNGKMSLGEIFDPKGNPFAHRFTDQKDIRTATVVIAASDSRNRYDCDLRGDGNDDEVQIDTLAAASYKIQLLEGNFSTGATITPLANSTLEGCGRGTIITLANNSDCHVITIGGDGVTIRDLKIVGNKANQGAGDWNGIVADDKDDGLLDNVAITDADYAGVRFLTACEGWRIRSCYFNANGTNSIKAYSGSHDFAVTNCIFNDDTSTEQISLGNADYAWVISNCDSYKGGYSFVYANGEDADPYNITVTNCYIASDFGGALRAGYGAHDIVFANNTVSGINTGQNGIFVDGGYNITISGNTINNTELSAIVLNASPDADAVTNVSIIGNTIYNPGQSDYQPAILLSGSTGVISDITIVGNSVHDDRASDYCDSAVWLANGNISRILINDNSFRIAQGIGIIFYDNTGGDDCQIIANRIYVSGTGIILDDGDDCMIADNRIIAGTAIDINDADVVRCMVMGNDWEGSTNDMNEGLATNARITSNIDRNGAWFAGEDPG